MYHYRECGLRNVWLANGYDEHDTPYGPGIAIHDVEGLHRAIAHGIVNKGGKLTGTELRFIRQEMSLSQAKLATMLRHATTTAVVLAHVWPVNSPTPAANTRMPPMRCAQPQAVRSNSKTYSWPRTKKSSLTMATSPCRTCMTPAMSMSTAANAVIPTAAMLMGSVDVCVDC